MKSLNGKIASGRGWVLLLALMLGASMMISACGDEEVPAPTTPTPPPPPAPEPEPEPEPEPTGPATPENLRVAAATSNSITWTWDAVEGALGYEGQFSPEGTFTDADARFIIPAPLTSHTIANLPANTTGHFRVRSGVGTTTTNLTFSDWTDGVSGSTTAPPAATALDAPGGVTTSDETEDSVTVSWNAVDDADSYEVEYRLAGAGGSWNDADCGDNGVVDGASCVVGDLDEGTDYEFRVRALPADDDDSHAVGEWAETDGTTLDAPDTPGGMGDLNVRWHNSGDNNRDIVFVWDRRAGAMYETATLALSGTSAGNMKVVNSVSGANPCGDLADVGSSDEPRYESLGSATSQSLTQSASGSVMGICVREEGSSNASFAWGISPLEEPDRETAPKVDDNETIELTWTDVDLKAGFAYDIKIAADPERPVAANRLGSASAPTSRAVQAACDAGEDVMDRFTTDIDLENRTISAEEDLLSPYTGYLLCIRALNDVGTGAWTVPVDTGNVEETFTRPAAPPTPGTPEIDIKAADATNNEQFGLTWEINTRDEDDIPRESSDFDVRVFTQAAADADRMTVADCDAASDAASYTRIDRGGLSIIDGLTGFEVSLAAGENTERTDFPRRVYMCARANSAGQGQSAAADGSGPGPWALSAAYNVARPRTSLSTDSGSLENGGATVEISGWNGTWYYTVTSTTADATGLQTCQSASASTHALTSLAPGTRYLVKAYGSQTACDNEERSLGSTSFTAK